MDRQKIFNKVALHLLEQNAKCINKTTGSCMYYGPDGLKCAVGCLISEKAYDPRIETNVNVKSDTVVTALEKSGISIDHSKGDINFLYRLQRIHDATDPSNWDDALEALGNEYELDVSLINERRKVQQ